MQIIYPNTVITNINSTRFLGLIIDSSFSSKDHINELTSKLNKACYAIRAIKPFMSLDAMKTHCMGTSVELWCILNNNTWQS